jgi:signal transduction histidine kinase
MKKSQPPPINLVDALRRDLPRLTVGTPIQVSVEQRGRLIPLPATLELVFFRIAQEAVTNALRHGDAKTIRVLLSWEDNCVILTVNDDGRGFDPASPAAAPGIGLLGMHERIAALAGSLEIQSAPGKGTCITATMPLLKEDS